MTSKKIEQIRTLLKGIETGDPESVAVVNQARYIQHNPQTHEGSEGLAELFKRLAKSQPRVNIVRIFEDGDYVFAHTEYDFANSNIGFEVFRFDHEQAVEHWDNIQRRQGPNPSGRSMVDGPTAASDFDQTEPNRELVRIFVDTILVKRRFDRMEHFIDEHSFTQHNPACADGLAAFRAALQSTSDSGDTIIYQRNHRLLAQGSFVLSVSEGLLDGTHTAFYDLFRIAEGMLVEHWDTIETIPARKLWKNNNGKF